MCYINMRRSGPDKILVIFQTHEHRKKRVWTPPIRFAANETSTWHLRRAKNLSACDPIKITKIMLHRQQLDMVPAGMDLSLVWVTKFSGVPGTSLRKHSWYAKTPTMARSGLSNSQTDYEACTSIKIKKHNNIFIFKNGRIRNKNQR